jgi:PAS domain-containing protein
MLTNVIERFVERRVRRKPHNILAQRLIDEAEGTITEIKKLTRELRRSQERAERYSRMLMHVIDTMPGIVWGKRLDGTFFLTNKTLRDTLLGGVSKKEALKLSAEMAANKLGRGDTLHLDCAATDKEVLETEKPGTFIERGYINNEYRVYRTSKAPYYNHEGKLVGTVGFGRDVTGDCAVINEGIEAIERALELCEGSCQSSNELAECLSRMKDIVIINYGTVCEEVHYDR